MPKALTLANSLGNGYVCYKWLQVQEIHIRVGLNKSKHISLEYKITQS